MALRVEPLAARRDALIDRAGSLPAEIAEAARAIVDDVRAGDDEALRALTKRFDGCDVAEPWLGQESWDALDVQTPDDLRAAIQANHDRIAAFHLLQVGSEQSMEVAPGVRLGRRAVPFERVACYAPGGRAAYPSTVLMTATLARIAGVEDVILVTPPDQEGTIAPAVATAAKIAGVSRILLAGGAQAIAAVAFGTSSVPRVDAIVGPGNAYMTAAKQIAAAEANVWTDAPAGPSELLVLADAGADPERIAWDLIAQAEHDPDAQVVLVTDSTAVATAVVAAIEALVPRAERRGIIEAALRDHAAVLVADDMQQAITFCNDYAAEHLEIHTADAAAVARHIRNAGSIFIGADTPVPLGDYGSGTNHVLPTMGNARTRGGLSVEDFRKWVTWQECTPEGLRAIGDDIATLARAEGLIGHAEAVERRLA